VAHAPQREAPTVAPIGGRDGLALVHNLDHSEYVAEAKMFEPQTSRIAIYEDPAHPPRIIDVPYTTARDTIGALAATTHSQLSALGAPFPYHIIAEACSNFIHAHFAEVVISITEAGQTLSFSDQGPGIAHPHAAQNTGFSSATPEMKQSIRGVGAGFTIMREYIESRNGSLRLASNLQGGTMLTLSVRPDSPLPTSTSLPVAADTPVRPAPHTSALRTTFPLTSRQKEVLTVFLRHEMVGPQLICDTLGIAVATAHRDLSALEHHGLVARTNAGKRTLSPAGFEYVEYLSSLD